MNRLLDAAAQAISLKQRFADTQAEAMDAAAVLIARALLHGRKVLACGNGGSASDASHFVGELVGRFRTERRSFPAICLASDPATVTAISNDYGYDMVFARQVEGYGKAEDVLLAISTSGQSRNVVAAAERANEIGMHVIALVGREVCPLAEESSVVISVPGPNTARIQEVHIFAIHQLCEQVDDYFDRLKLVAP